MRAPAAEAAAPSHEQVTVAIGQLDAGQPEGQAACSLELRVRERRTRRHLYGGPRCPGLQGLKSTSEVAVIMAIATTGWRRADQKTASGCAGAPVAPLRRSGVAVNRNS
jgi:hypothetical protein